MFYIPWTTYTSWGELVKDGKTRPSGSTMCLITATPAHLSCLLLGFHHSVTPASDLIRVTGSMVSSLLIWHSFWNCWDCDERARQPWKSKRRPREIESREGLSAICSVDKAAYLIDVKRRVEEAGIYSIEVEAKAWHGCQDSFAILQFAWWHNPNGLHIIKLEREEYKRMTRIIKLST